jgi:hypothetical protein
MRAFAALRRRPGVSEALLAGMVAPALDEDLTRASLSGKASKGRSLIRLREALQIMGGVLQRSVSGERPQLAEVFCGEVGGLRAPRLQQKEGAQPVDQFTMELSEVEAVSGDALEGLKTRGKVVGYKVVGKLADAYIPGEAKQGAGVLHGWRRPIDSDELLQKVLGVSEFRGTRAIMRKPFLD